MLDDSDLTPLTQKEWDRWWPFDPHIVADYHAERHWEKKCCGLDYMIWHPGYGLVCVWCRKPFKR